jgi:di/tricarboxylate transporter
VLDILEKDIEWPTLAFFLFLFILVGAAVATGLIESLAHGLAGSSTGSRRLGLSPRRPAGGGAARSSGSRASCRP